MGSVVVHTSRKVIQRWSKPVSGVDSAEPRKVHSPAGPVAEAKGVSSSTAVPLQPDGCTPSGLQSGEIGDGTTQTLQQQQQEANTFSRNPSVAMRSRSKLSAFLHDRIYRSFRHFSWLVIALGAYISGIVLSSMGISQTVKALNYIYE